MTSLALPHLKSQGDTLRKLFYFCGLAVLSQAFAHCTHLLRQHKAGFMHRFKEFLLITLHLVFFLLSVHITAHVLPLALFVNFVECGRSWPERLSVRTLSCLSESMSLERVTNASTGQA